jgi:hypothetical protein
MNDLCDMCSGWRQISHINRYGEYVCIYCAEGFEFDEEEEDYGNELEDEEEEATEGNGAR